MRFDHRQSRYEGDRITHDCKQFILPGFDHFGGSGSPAFLKNALHLSPIRLAVSSGRDRLRCLEDRRNLPGGQQPGGRRSNTIQSFGSVFFTIGENDQGTDGATIPGLIDDDTGIQDTIDATEGRLDGTKLDPPACDLDLSIESTTKLQSAVRSPSHSVTGAIHGFIFTGVASETITVFRLSIRTQIPKADSGSGGHELPEASGWYLVTHRIEDSQSGSPNGSTDWYGSPRQATDHDRLACGEHRVLGGPVSIHDREFRIFHMQTSNMIGGHHVASGQDDIEIREQLGKAIDPGMEECRRQPATSDLIAPHPVLKGREIGRRSLPAAHGSTIQKRPPDLQRGCIECERRRMKHSESGTSGKEPGIVDQPVNRTMWDHCSSWLPGGSRSEHRIER